MAIRNAGGAYMPDFYPPQQQGWVQFDEDPQINAGPAAAAFKSRFLSGPTATPHQMDQPHMPDMPTVAPHEELGSAEPLHGSALTDPMKQGIKSL